jgi:hypothetical protein
VIPVWAVGWLGVLVDLVPGRDSRTLAPAIEGDPAGGSCRRRELRLPLDMVLVAVATLPVTLGERDEYTASLREAERRIGQRAPDNIDTLALALHLDAPVWSNDRDFEGAGVEWYTTARLLKTLELGHG